LHHGGGGVGIIGKFREFRQPKHAIEQIYALTIESKAGQEFIFGDDPRGKVRRYPVRVNEFLVERAETRIGEIIHAVEPVARVIERHVPAMPIEEAICRPVGVRGSCCQAAMV
jgi:hypothetical protein